MPNKITINARFAINNQTSNVVNVRLFITVQLNTRSKIGTSTSYPVGSNHKRLNRLNRLQLKTLNNSNKIRFKIWSKFKKTLLNLIKLI